MNRIAIHSVPRSGSTWLGQILNSSPQVVYKYQPLFSYAFKDRLNQQSTVNDIKKFFSEISVYEDDFLDQKEAIQKGYCPVFEKDCPPQHCVYKEVRYHHIIANLLDKDPEIKVVGIVRNPHAVLASWVHAPKEFKPEWDFESEWRNAPAKNMNRPEEFYGFEKWKEVASLFVKLQSRYPDRFRLIKYTELLTQTLTMTQSLFDFLAIPWQAQTEEFLIASRTQNHKDAYSVFKQKRSDDGWQGKIPESICKTIESEILGTELEVFLDTNRCR